MKRDELLAAGMPVFRVPVDAIEVPQDRLRSLKPMQAAAIGAAIVADRQYDPITVARLPGQDGFVLVDGLHRLIGMRGQGREFIDARIVSGDRASRRQQEVLSAWARAGHDVFDKAAQIGALAEMAKAPVGAEDASAMIALGLNWDEATAEALGISRRSVFNYLKIDGIYDAAQRDLLRARGMADELVPLLRLAALPPEDFGLAWAAIEAGQVASIAEALAMLAPAPVNSFDKSRAKVVKAVGDWPAGEIRGLIDALRAVYAEKVKPS